MSIEGQGHFYTIYFPGFVCFVLYEAKISGERLQDHWSSGFMTKSSRKNVPEVGVDCSVAFFFFSPLEPRYEKTVFFHMRKQRRRSASR